MSNNTVQEGAYQEAAIELGKGIALGLVPILGQVIDAYDTLESAIALYNAKKEDDIDNARFEFVLSIVGWIPGPGDGVKKSLRIVNKNPDRFAPVLFELLRFVLKECGIKTSPEALLAGIFDPGVLRAQLKEATKGVEDSQPYKALPRWLQEAVTGVLNQALASMPVMVAVVHKRLRIWKGKQRNSSAAEAPRGKSKGALHKAKDGEIGKKGDDAPAHTHANESSSSTFARRALNEVTQEMAGICGEHIADYYCVEHFGWGSWKRHDDGINGAWAQTPDHKTPGKLSSGGSPKDRHKLYRVDDGPNGTGIDAVWRAEGHNHGKKYAIVEAKATVDEDAPKFMRKTNNTRKPSVASTLGKNVIKEAAELLEPLEEDVAQAAGGASGKKTIKRGGGTGSSVASKPAPSPASSPRGKKGKVTDIKVQMSVEWISDNLTKSVGEAVSRNVKLSYARHLFYSPAYYLGLKTGTMSPKDHMLAKLGGTGPETHATHDAIHYDNDEVKAAVNKRKAALRERHSRLPSLKAE